MAEYIEREALLKRFDDVIPRKTYCTVESAVRRIKDAPTADVAPVVHGRWINWGKSGTPTYENYGTCSVCHEDAEIHTEHRNYCPNCGAKMDGERE